MHLHELLINTPLWLNILIGGIFGFYLRKKALKDRKDHTLWFMIGFFFGLLGVFAYWIKNFFSGRKRTFTVMSSSKKKAQQDASIPTIRFSAAPWYYLDENHVQQGPISYQFLSGLFIEGKITASSFVWNEELENWENLEKLLLQ